MLSRFWIYIITYVLISYGLSYLSLTDNKGIWVSEFYNIDTLTFLKEYVCAIFLETSVTGTIEDLLPFIGLTIFAFLFGPIYQYIEEKRLLSLIILYFLITPFLFYYFGLQAVDANNIQIIINHPVYFLFFIMGCAISSYALANKNNEEIGIINTTTILAFFSFGFLSYFSISYGSGSSPTVSLIMVLIGISLSSMQNLFNYIKEK
jgi:hypothetical protein